MLSARLEHMNVLEAEGRHGELLAFLQQMYAEAEQLPAPARTEYFMTLFQWKMLIEKYPPAADALVQARDEQARRLLAGELFAGTGGALADALPSYERVERFSLIVEMDNTLGQPRATYALFLQLEAAQPELAGRHAWRALPAIVEAGDFALADRYRGDPLDLLANVNYSAATMPLFPPGREAPQLAADLTNLARQAGIGIAVLRGLGREAEAQALRAALLSGLANEELRALAQRELDVPGTIIRMAVERQTALEGGRQAQAPSFQQLSV